MDAARLCKWRDCFGIEVRLQSYIRPTAAEVRSAWPWWYPLRKASSL